MRMRIFRRNHWIQFKQCHIFAHLMREGEKMLKIVPKVPLIVLVTNFFLPFLPSTDTEL
jgi:hypothetical protein